MASVRLGVIGIGNIGTAHINTILEKIPEIIITAAADIDEKRRAWAANFFGNTFPVFTDGNELIEKGGRLVDAVLIAVPHYGHPELVIKALKAGLHVLCEKPAGVYTKQVREMNEIAQKSDKVFAMMYNQRTNSHYKKMHEIVKSGALGAIMRTNWIITNWYRTEAYYKSGGWRGTWKGEGGGVLLNQSPHQLDLFQWICGMPNRVRAFCHNGKWHNIEVEDDVTAYLEYPNGATGVFITSTGETPGANRFEISFEKGKIINDGGNDITTYTLDANCREFCVTSNDAYAAPKCTVEKPEVTNDNPQHEGILRNFAARILRGEPLIAEGAQGINGLTLTNAMYLSSWLDKTIDIPFDEDLFLNELNKRRKT